MKGYDEKDMASTTSNLETIEIILKWGNITKAAIEMEITQPGLTSWINKLEKKLGYQVFDRSISPIVLTKEGKCYKDYLKQCKVLEHNLDSKIKEIKNNYQKIIVGAPSSYISTVLVDVVAEFKKLEPNCCVEIIESTVPYFEKKLEVGDIDLFISTSNSNKMLSYIPIRTEKIMICVLKDSNLDCKLAGMLQEKGEISYEVLNHYDFVMLRKNQPLQIEVDKFIEKHHLNINKSIVVNQVPVAVEFVEKLGYNCFASECTIEKMKNNDSLKFYSLEKEIPSREIYLAYNKNHYQSKLITAFISVVKNYRGK